MSIEHLKPFQPGETGNPGGKPVGARNRLTARFLNDLAKHYEEHGVDAITRLCKDDPAGYVKVIAALCPKEVEITRTLEDMNADKLLDAVRALESFLAARPAEEGTGASGSELPTH